MIVTQKALKVAEVVFPIFKFFAAGQYRQNYDHNAPRPMSSCVAFQLMQLNCRPFQVN